MRRAKKHYILVEFTVKVPENQTNKCDKP